MVYVNENPGAKFGNAQNGLKAFLNLPTRLAIHSARIKLQHPGSWFTRSRRYRGFAADVAPYRDAGFDRTGYLDVTKSEAPAIQAAVQRWRPRLDEKLQQHGEDCPRSPYSLEELLADDTIRALAFHPAIIKRIAAYLGEVPMLANIDMWIGQRMKLRAGSPFYHLDSAGWGNARFYVYLSDVQPGFGEFTYIPRQQSEAYARQTYYLGDGLSDAQVDTFFGAGKSGSQSVLGPAGTSFLIDTTRCLHFGSRCTEGNRYVVIFNYQRWATPNSPLRDIANILRGQGNMPTDPILRSVVED